MKITSVEPQKKNLKRFNIFLDGQFIFGADEDLVVDRRLVVGKEISQSDLEQILQETEVGKIMERMYRLFNIRQRSEREVRDYLKRLSFKRKLKSEDQISTMVVDAVIEKLKRKNMINDSEFAKSWANARRISKNKGKIAIKAELFQKGINREIVEEIVSQSNVSEEDLAEQALMKRLKRWESLDPIEVRKKAMEFLMRRGFEFDVVKKVVEKSIKKEYNTKEW